MHIPGNPCDYCGNATPLNGDPCPDCWTVLDIPTAKALFAAHGLSADSVPREGR